MVILTLGIGALFLMLLCICITPGSDLKEKSSNINCAVVLANPSSAFVTRQTTGAAFRVLTEEN